MVVTRRQSAAPPPPPASRTNSSQGVGTSRIASASSLKGKNTDRGLSDDASNSNTIQIYGSPLKNGNYRVVSSRNTPADASTRTSSAGPKRINDIKTEDMTPQQDDMPSEAPTSSKGSLPKTKLKPKPKRGPRTKKNRYEKSNKGIRIFDILARLFLLWFTIYTIAVCPDDVQTRSPICRALTEYRRLVLEPYILPPIQAALQHPTIASAVHRVRPMYSTTVKFTAPVVRRTTREWRTRVQPQIAWLRIRARPYIRQIQRKYEATLDPYVKNLIIQYQNYIQPGVDVIISNADKQWRAVRPYVRPIWKAAKRIPGVIFRILVRLVINAKRRWVDPQIAKIWVAIMEQERANRDGIPVVESVDVTEIIDATTSVGVTPAPTPVVSEVSESFASPETIPVPIPPTFDITDEIAASVIQETFSPFISVHLSTKVIVTPTKDPEFPTVDSELFSMEIPIVTDEAAASAASIIVDSLSLSPEGTSILTVDPLVNYGTQSVGDEDGEDLDMILDEFLEDISTDVELESSVVLEPSTREETAEEKEEQLRQRQIETAKQRADLEKRHTRWEQEIEKLGETQRNIVKKTLVHLREVAVEEAQDSAGPVRKQIVDIVNDAEKSLKGLRAFAKKLLSQDEKEKDGRMTQWNEVVAKVEKKFESRLDNSSQAVREWIGERLQMEMRELEGFAAALTRLANQAQEDLGMGYTWLADVTYHDWQRYHKLAETAKSFVDDYRRFQNAPPNPLNDAMELLQEEVDDIVLGFQASIGHIRNLVLDKLVLVNSGEVDENVENVETSATLNLGPPLTDMDTSDSEHKPEMSILPIDIEESNIIRDGDRKIPHGVIRSRDAEEVRHAIERAEGFGHEEL